MRDTWSTFLDDTVVCWVDDMFEAGCSMLIPRSYQCCGKKWLQDPRILRSITLAALSIARRPFNRFIWCHSVRWHRPCLEIWCLQLAPLASSYSTSFCTHRASCALRSLTLTHIHWGWASWGLWSLWVRSLCPMWSLPWSLDRMGLKDPQSYNWHEI